MFLCIVLLSTYPPTTSDDCFIVSLMSITTACNCAQRTAPRYNQSLTLLQYNIWAIALFVNFTKPTACSNSKFKIAVLQRYKKHPSRHVTHHKIKKNKRTITKKNHKEKQQTTSSKHHQMITTSNDNH